MKIIELAVAFITLLGKMLLIIVVKNVVAKIEVSAFLSVNALKIVLLKKLGVAAKEDKIVKIIKNVNAYKVVNSVHQEYVKIVSIQKD